SSPTTEITPTSYPGLASTTTMSPTFKSSPFKFLKNDFRLFLNRISTISYWLFPLGSCIFANQSKTPSLLHPPELQVPLFLQPRGVHPPMRQLEHPIIIIFIKSNKY